MTSPYEVLGVRADADVAEIRRAYLRIARRHHPDVVADADPATRAEADQRMRDANEAWHVLGDPARRRAHDLGFPPGAVVDEGATFRPFDTGPDPDPLDLPDEPYRPDPGARSARRRVATIAPVALFAASVATFAVGVVVSVVPLVAVSVVLLVASVVGFVVVPLLALGRAVRDEG